MTGSSWAPAAPDPTTCSEVWLPPKPTAAVLDAARRLGRVTLAPVLAAFATLLLSESRRRGLDRLAFLARDGHFLMTVTDLVAAGASITSPQLLYVHLTRRSTALAAAGHLQAPELSLAAGVRAGAATWGSALAYYGIDGDAAGELLASIGAKETSLLPHGSQLAGLIEHDHWQSQVRSLARQRRDLLAAYLRQSRLADGSSAAIVDIGWRATIQHNLMRLAATINDAPCPAGLYLGLWADDPGAIPTGLDCTGLITDLRRRRRLDEAGAWYVACLLEAICRADEGTTVGYRCAGNTVVPILAGPGPARSAESRSQEVVAQVRAGVIEGIAERHFLTSANNLQLRSDAQRRLLRLAFFPDAGEIVVASHLVHTEGHAPDWSSPLVLDDRPNPLLTPRRWLAGLASPWRGGYVMATGRGAAHLHRGLESLLIMAPPGLRQSIRRFALGLATSRHRLIRPRR